jgi:hypothetical protein
MPTKPAQEAGKPIGRSLGQSKLNPIAQNLTWAANCEKELQRQLQWHENWACVYFPERNDFDIDSRVRELSETAEKLKHDLNKSKAERETTALEPKAQYGRKACGELFPAYPY